LRQADELVESEASRQVEAPSSSSMVISLASKPKPYNQYINHNFIVNLSTKRMLPELPAIVGKREFSV
jgi:hypothetical protein